MPVLLSLTTLYYWQLVLCHCFLSWHLSILVLEEHQPLTFYLSVTAGVCFLGLNLKYKMRSATLVYVAITYWKTEKLNLVSG